MYVNIFINIIFNKYQLPAHIDKPKTSLGFQVRGYPMNDRLREMLPFNGGYL